MAIHARHSHVEVVAARFTLKFKGPDGRNVMQMLLEDQTALESEIEHAVRFEIGDSTGDDYQVVGVMLVDHKPCENRDVESEQLACLLKTVNLLVNALRPRLAAPPRQPKQRGGNLP